MSMPALSGNHVLSFSTFLNRLRKCRSDRMNHLDIVGGGPTACMAVKLSLLLDGDSWMVAVSLKQPRACYSFPQVDRVAAADLSATVLYAGRLLAHVGRASLLLKPHQTPAGRRISASHPACKSELMMLCDRFIRNFGRLGPEGQPTEILLNDVVQQVAPLQRTGCPCLRLRHSIQECNNRNRGRRCETSEC